MVVRRSQFSLLPSMPPPPPPYPLNIQCHPLQLSRRYLANQRRLRSHGTGHRLCYTAPNPRMQIARAHTHTLTALPGTPSHGRQYCSVKARPKCRLAFGCAHRKHLRGARSAQCARSVRVQCQKWSVVEHPRAKGHSSWGLLLEGVLVIFVTRLSATTQICSKQRATHNFKPTSPPPPFLIKPNPPKLVLGENGHIFACYAARVCCQNQGPFWHHLGISLGTPQLDPLGYWLTANRWRLVASHQRVMPRFVL